MGRVGRRAVSPALAELGPRPRLRSGDVIRFADCELNLDRIVLRRGGEEIRIEPQVFDVLAYLVKHRGSVVRKEELLDAVWGDRFVSESALTTRIKAVRQAVGDDGRQQSIIRTVHGKGYEFVALVEEVEESRPPVDMSRAEPRTSIGLRLQPLIGRESSLEQLAEMISEHRLVTLVGPGGVGKTSLGMELARTIGGQFEDGVHVVELVGVVDEDATTAALATAIDVNLRKSSSIDDAIIDLLRPRHSLLVLDNCEHLIEPVAGLVARILREAPDISIVATSQEPLAVTGERLWTVDPLLTGPEELFGAELVLEELAEIPAVALFVARAKAVDSSFILDKATAPLVIEICQRLDGIPLAIELAAARARSIGVAEVARRLDQRFNVLKAMRRDSDPRHRTMHDAISWSYDMLEPDERSLFTALSVFAGSFALRSAEVMAPEGDALDLVTRLTERSMLAVRPQANGSTRYELLETLREYGRTRLSDAQAAELFATHANHFAQEAGAVEVELCGPAEGGAIARTESSLADLRAAQRFALELGALDVTFGIISSIREFAMRAMRYEIFAWADAACHVAGALDHPLAPTLTGMRAYGAWVRGEFGLAVELAEETRRLEDALSVFPSGLAERVLANVSYIAGDAMTGHDEALRQIELAEGSGNRSRLAHACYLGAVGHSSNGDYDEAGALVERVFALARETGSATDLASAEVARGFVSRTEDVALEAFTASERIAGSVGNRWMQGFAFTEASGLLISRGELEPGCAGLADMVGVWYRAGDWSQQWHTLSRCLIALDRIGQTDLALELLGAIEKHAMLGVAPMSSILQDLVVATRTKLMESTSTTRAGELLAAGAACPVVDIVLRTRRALIGAG
jgi:predicted ATPase/DNA-binding winged helix-turn-helix (wHTH) protein